MVYLSHICLYCFFQSLCPVCPTITPQVKTVFFCGRMHPGAVLILMFRRTMREQSIRERNLREGRA